MPIKLIGRTNNFSGKTLWEIVGNLKNFGVGRVIVRNVFQRYPEPTYMKIMKVEPLANEEVRKVRVWVEKVHRGYKYPKLVKIESVSYKADYRLIPKDEESKLLDNATTMTERILPREIDFPPLLKKIVLKSKLERGEQIPEKLTLPLPINNGPDNRARIATAEEKPNVEVVMGLGTPISPKLYQNCL